MHTSEALVRKWLFLVGSDESCGRLAVLVSCLYLSRSENNDYLSWCPPRVRATVTCLRLGQVSTVLFLHTRALHIIVHRRRPRRLEMVPILSLPIRMAKACSRLVCVSRLIDRLSVALVLSRKKIDVANELSRQAKEHLLRSPQMWGFTYKRWTSQSDKERLLSCSALYHRATAFPLLDKPYQAQHRHVDRYYHEGLIRPECH